MTKEVLYYSTLRQQVLRVGFIFLFVSQTVSSGDLLLSCKKPLEYFLESNLEDLILSIPQKPVSLSSAEKARFLKYNFPKTLSLAPAERRQQCLEESTKLYDQMIEAFKTRLKSLLEEKQVDLFYREYRKIIVPINAQKEKLVTRNLFLDLEQDYLKAIHQTLITELATGPWHHYTSLKFHLVVWSPEWLEILGREVSAAVEHQNNKIVLNPIELSPTELKIFLFHELAHLSDHQYTKPLDREVYAWDQTLQYLSTLQSVPPRFQNIQSNIHLLGLKNWVFLVRKSINSLLRPGE